MRYALLACALLLGCGDSGNPGMPGPLVGAYTVQIAANGKMDDDVMSVSPASNDGVLLDFVYGISQVRCDLMGASSVSIPRQKLHVSHSTGIADGVATGSGTIGTDGTVDIKIDLVTAGIGPMDGTPVTYEITGSKN